LSTSGTVSTTNAMNPHTNRALLQKSLTQVGLFCTQKRLATHTAPLSSGTVPITQDKRSQFSHELTFKVEFGIFRTNADSQ